jgi:glutathione S-transferase
MPSISTLNWENSIKQMAGQGPASAVEVERAEAGFVAACQILDQHLAGREWICGQQPSLADLAIAAPLADWQRARLPLASSGKLPAGSARFKRWTAGNKPSPSPACRLAEYCWPCAAE